MTDTLKDNDIRDYYKSYNIELTDGLFGYNSSLDTAKEVFAECVLQFPDNLRLIFEDMFSSSAGCDIWFIFKDTENFYHKYYFRDTRGAIMGGNYSVKFVSHKISPTFEPLIKEFWTFGSVLTMY